YYVTDAERDGGGMAHVINGRAAVNANWNWRTPAAWTTEPQHPVVQVSWNDAQAFCSWLSRKEGRIYRLPTEAEWEYACRAGTESFFFSGDDPAELAAYAWTGTEGQTGLHPVGTLRPNAFGLFDMHGNVTEWCHDRVSADWYRNGDATDPTGPESGTDRCI